jgi:aminoglycoside phosphotransferase family enzyme/predicted kinase
MARAGPIEAEALAAAQADVITFLSDPASYNHVERVDRVETHGNLLFLAGEEAWKIKRAVVFPYMDFSTLEKRRSACSREVEINRRFGSPLYLGCVPITRSRAGRLAFGGDAAIVEWAVHMRRFEQAALLSSIARRIGIANDLAADLADLIYASQQLAETASFTSGAAPVRRLTASVAGALSKSAIASAAVERLEGGLTAAIGTAAATLDARAAEGFVRRCHGDLHLDNIIVWQGRPVLYDAIEFDEAIATIDTLYDLAFLLMDLDRLNQRAAANVVLNRYLWRSGENLDLQGLIALPLFLALRAAVRAMVSADRAAQKPRHAAASNLKKAGAYLAAARDYLALPGPYLIAIGGLSGTGKTTLATSIAPRLGRAPGAVHLRTDLERKRLAGVDALERLPAAAYTPAARRRIYRALREKARCVLLAGQSVIIDAVFAEQEARQDVEALATEAGVAFKGLWLHAGSETLLERVAARRSDASDATPEVVGRQLAGGPGPFTVQWTALDAGGTSQQTLAAAGAALRGFESPMS